MVAKSAISLLRNKAQLKKQLCLIFFRHTALHFILLPKRRGQNTPLRPWLAGDSSSLSLRSIIWCVAWRGFFVYNP